MSANEAGGSLFQLPREIIDEIYSPCFRKSYLVLWPPYWYEHKINDRAILQVSKAVSSDVKHFLFSRSASKAITFKFKILFDVPGFCTPPTKEATDRMMNIDFKAFIDLRAMDFNARNGGFDPDSHMSLICEATVDRFAGTEVIRDNFRVSLAFEGPYSEYLEFIKLRFFQTLKKLSGFHNLIVVLQYDMYYEQDLSIEDHKGIRDVLMELEPHLGPCSRKGPTYELIRGGLYFDLEFEFHPLKFHVENLRMEAARLTKEADRLEGCELQDI